ncbi:hypothetical protein Nepgr_022040 [Nepenthes gracilis]|uniref:VQ domain-containing protein n=1 Tax=Nepenthes gracilis TaxID=150966 RepID=A0AAD3T012_NEPGR|nr:hypothetical protein Nepgr_022040 [Nepenthes gracilis]
MERLKELKQNKKSTKMAKPKIKKPLKVVYFSNPVRITTTAAEFRALVQELTGRDAESPDPHKLSFIAGESQAAAMAMEKAGYGDHGKMLEVPEEEVDPAQVLLSSDLYFEPFDDDVPVLHNHPTLENFVSMMMPPS